jgi:uncharacterized protein YoaH (UPF0181 family)
VSSGFAHTFQTLCKDLYSEVHLQFTSRDAAVWRLTSADRLFRKTFLQIEQQLDLRQISTGYAINLVVLAIEHYLRSQNGRKPFLSVARLQRALSTFFDLEMRNYYAHLPTCNTVIFADANAFRSGFIGELQTAGYIQLVNERSGETIAVVTEAFRERMLSPGEISPSEVPIAFDLKAVFRKG